MRRRTLTCRMPTASVGTWIWHSKKVPNLYFIIIVTLPFNSSPEPNENLLVCMPTAVGTWSDMQNKKSSLPETFILLLFYLQCGLLESNLDLELPAPSLKSIVLGQNAPLLSYCRLESEDHPPKNFLITIIPFSPFFNPNQDRITMKITTRNCNMARNMFSMIIGL